MPSFDAVQLPPPANWQDFESLCLVLWRDIWNDANTQKNGRSGQEQAGVDVFGKCDGEWVGVQCKGRDFYFGKPIKEKELREEAKKAIGFQPHLSKFILATTAQRDAKIQKVAREITEESGDLEVSVWSWEDIREEIGRRKHLIEELYPQLLTSPPNRDCLGQFDIPITLGKLFADRNRRIDLLAGHFIDEGGGLKPAVPLILVGPGGSGKTRAAVEFAQEFKDKFVNQVRIRANNIKVLNEHLSNLASPVTGEEFAYNESSRVKQAVERLAKLSSSPTLLFFDGIEDSSTAIYVQKLFSRLQGAAIVVTSRVRNWGLSSKEVSLPELPISEIHKYLNQSLGSNEPSEMVAVLADKLAFLPLGLEAAVGYMRIHGVSIAAYLELLNSKSSDILDWHDDLAIEYPQSIWNVFALCLEQIELLDKFTSTILSTSAWLGPAAIPIGLHLQSFDKRTLQLMSEKSGQDLEYLAEFDFHHSLQNLHRYCLIQDLDKKSHTYSIHSITREIIRSKENADGQGYIQSLIQVMLLEGAGDPQQPVFWHRWELLRPHVSSILKDAEDLKIALPTSWLASQVGRYLEARGAFEDAEFAYRRALKINRDAWGDKGESPSVDWGHLGMFDRGKPSNLIAENLVDIGSTLIQQDRPKHSEPFIHEALKALGDGEENRIRVRALQLLGSSALKQSKLDEAEINILRAHELATEISEPFDMLLLKSYREVAKLHFAKGDISQGDEAIKQSVRIAFKYRRLNYEPVPTICNRDMVGGPMATEELMNQRRPPQWLLVKKTRALRRSYSKYHPELALTLHELAKARIAQGNPNKALPLLDAALGINWFAYGPFHPSTELTWASMDAIETIVSGKPGGYFEWMMSTILYEIQNALTDDSSTTE